MTPPAPRFTTVIGLEVHAQLQTTTKMFCRCPTQGTGGPNGRVCPVCLGLPGALPVPNQEAVRLGVRAALALGCQVQPRSQFARKSYFYPDLPKGYQISQHDRPLAWGGELVLPGSGAAPRRIPLLRLHLEEDAGRSQHVSPPGEPPATLLDFDRCGIPLVEIVTRPALGSPQEASDALKELRTLLRTLGVCDGNLENGSFRCDANLSLRPADDPTLGTRVEIKNLNSFRHLRLALEEETARQTELLAQGRPVAPETRQFDPSSGRTLVLRNKEESKDYRYFPDPDLPELVLAEDWLHAQRAALPELPAARRARFVREHGLSDYEAGVLVTERAVADHYEALLEAGARSRPAASWVLNEVLRVWDGSGDGPPPVPPAALAELLALLGAGAITGTVAKQVWEELRQHGGEPAAIVTRLGLGTTTDLDPTVRRVLAAHPAQVAQYRAGKAALLGFFIGQAMRELRGRADATELGRRFAALLEGEDEPTGG